MEFFIKKLFEGKRDDLVHLQFEKFSRGKFDNRALVEAKFSKDRYSINTSGEYAGEFARAVAHILGDKKTKVTGVVVSTRDLTGIVNFVDKKQFAGVKKYVLDTEMSGKEILALCEKLPRAFIGLSFSAEGTELKVKPKAPKSGKPGKPDEEAPKADFCKLKTDNKEIVKAILFDIDHFKQVKIAHTFLIDDIEIPKNEPDPVKMREGAVRKGKIIRKITVDGTQLVKEVKFAA